MHAFKNLHILNYPQIQQQLLAFAQELFVNITYTSRKETTLEQITERCPGLIEFFTDNNLQWLSARFFYTAPNDSIPIHIDGSDEYPCKFAINFPVIGCENTRMTWWKNVDLVARVDDNYDASGLRIFDSKFKTVLDNLELLEPALVKIDIPHNVTNTTAYPRIIWSVRFSPEPTHLFY
jgi:hypothetical protein